MIRTRVGYAGGKAPDPNYRRMGDHTEAFQVDFDPQRISFAELLEVFWGEHNPCAKGWSVQYQSILFYDGEAQRVVAEKSARELSKSLGRPVLTGLRPTGSFYRAEDYHQKYTLRRRHELVADLRALYPSERAFQDATAVAKVHAYVDGHLGLAALRRELAALGLRAVGERRLEGIERAETAAAGVEKD